MAERIVATCLTKALVVASAHEAQTASGSLRTVDVVYRSGEITLAALLLMPRTEQPVPAAVIIQGSGSSDRSIQWSRDMADALLRNRIAVLLTDKRGSGATSGDWRVAGFTELEADALAGVEFLQSRPDIDRRRVGLVGLSHGGWVAPLAAARSAEVATARHAGLSDSLVQEVIRLNAATARYVTTGDWEQYARTRARHRRA